MRSFLLSLLVAVVSMAQSAPSKVVMVNIPETIAFLGDRPWNIATNGWGVPERNRSNGELLATDGQLISLNGATYPKGIGAHAPSAIGYNLGGLCTTFTAVIGVDDEVASNGSVVFQVYADTVLKFDSGTMTGDMPGKEISVAIGGTHELSLMILDAGNGIAYDHGDWANAAVSCAAERQAPTVISTTPANGSTVGTTNSITATFSEDMDPATINEQTVTVTQEGSTIPIPVTVTYDPATRIVTLTPR